MSEDRTVTIDGQEYPFDSLSDKAKNQLANLKITDQRIDEIKRELAIHQTARNAYAQALKGELPKN
ncbi:MAG: hypothetical protein AAF865_06845 [Pseudomonadota bacterium]